MHQPLRAVAVLLEDPDSAPSTHIVASNHWWLLSGDLTSSLDLHKHHACTWYTYTYAGKTLT